MKVSISDVVTGGGKGSATIIGKTGSGKTASCKVTVKIPSTKVTMFPSNTACKVTVKEIKSTSIQVDHEEINLISGQMAKIGITILPANATDDITWSSSDENIVRVASDGTITAVKEGEAFV